MAGWKHVGGLSQRLLLCTGPAQGKRGRASRHRHCGWRTSGVPSRSMRHSGVFEAHSACGRRLVLRALWPADPPRSAANGVAAETTPAEAAPASAGTTPTGTSEDEELLKKGARALRDFLRARRSVRTLRKLQDSFELRLAKARYETPSCRTLASVDAAIPAAARSAVRTGGQASAGFGRCDRLSRGWKRRSRTCVPSRCTSESTCLATNPRRAVAAAARRSPRRVQ